MLIGPHPPANLPADFVAQIRSNNPVIAAPWRLVDRRLVHGVRPGLPRVVRFDLSSHGDLPTPADLPAQANRGLLVLVHQWDRAVSRWRWDPFIGTELAVQDLCTLHRQAAYQSIRVLALGGPGTNANLRQRAVAAGVRLTALIPDAETLEEATDIPAPADPVYPYRQAMRHIPNVLAVAVLAMTGDKLRALRDQLAAKVAAATNATKIDRQILTMARSAAEMIAAGGRVPAPSDLSIARVLSPYAVMGCMAWDLPDMVDMLAPQVGWTRDGIHRGAPDPNWSQRYVPTGQLLARAGEIAAAYASEADRPKVQAFYQGMACAMATKVVCNPMLRSLQAEVSSLDWDGRWISPVDIAASTWVSRELFDGLPEDDARWRAWFPEPGKVPKAIFQGFAEALREIYDWGEVRRRVFAEVEAQGLDDHLPDATDLAKGYGIWHRSMGSGIGWGGFYAITLGVWC